MLPPSVRVEAAAAVAWRALAASVVAWRVAVSVPPVRMAASSVVSLLVVTWRLVAAAVVSLLVMSPPVRVEAAAAAAWRVMASSVPPVRVEAPSPLSLLVAASAPPVREEAAAVVAWRVMELKSSSHAPGPRSASRVLTSFSFLRSSSQCLPAVFQEFIG
ncbi:hypothetical protein T484DRAFT_1815545 [Baffinella frigidus]|nr:hypothetical protein T484DRAFT_1815545 [Cryptophyta sp. CCMP2293]